VASITAVPEREAGADRSVEFLPIGRGRIRFIPPLETYPRVVAFAATGYGRSALLLLFGLLLAPANPLWLPITMGAAACAYAGSYRRWVLLPATLGLLCLAPQGTMPARIAAAEGVTSALLLALLPYLTLAAIFALSAAAIAGALRFPRSLIFRRPILSLHVLVVGLLLFAGADILHGAARLLLWFFLVPLCGYFWFLSYALRDQRASDRWPVLPQLGIFHPFWGSTSTPFGKGAAYLRRVEAANAQELAVTQLKGLKLLIWAYFLKALSAGFAEVIHGYLQVPTFGDAFAQQIAGLSVPPLICWAALISRFFEDLLSMAIGGHVIVASARMAGFRLLRNTYKPLAARTIAEFWNRYYFYFKELLVEFYYYPTFLRCFKRHRRLRMLFATFAAAGAGNAFFHFIRDVDYVDRMGLAGALVGYQTYLFYCVLLSVGIGLSQLRQTRRRAERGFRATVAAPASVAAFYCMLLVFNDEGRQYSLADHFRFLFHLLGAGQWM